MSIIGNWREVCPLHTLDSLKYLEDHIDYCESIEGLDGLPPQIAIC